LRGRSVGLRRWPVRGRRTTVARGRGRSLVGVVHGRAVAVQERFLQMLVVGGAVPGYLGRQAVVVARLALLRDRVRPGRPVVVRGRDRVRVGRAEQRRTGVLAVLGKLLMRHGVTRADAARRRQVEVARRGAVDGG
jgi:hypothetical protein